MKVSKVEFGNDTVMDITDSTVTENNLLSGEIAYGSDGERVVGTVTVPTVNNSTITIKENGSTVDSFTLNQSSDKAIDIPVNQSYYGTCVDNGDVVAKTVTISNQNFKLAIGALISVKFSSANSASNVTLNVNGTGDKSIWYNGSVYAGASGNVCGYTDRITTYIYDGTYWVWQTTGVVIDSNTHRPINVNGTQLLGNNTTAVNFKNGTNTTVVGSGADIQINATDTNTTYTFAEGTTNGAFTVTPSTSGATAQTVNIHGLGSAAYTASTAYATSDHVHGNITNDGKVSSDITIADGDKLLITDASDSNKVVTSSIAFNGSTATQCLTRKGTWANFTNNSGTITKVTTSEGAHTAIDISSGAVSFNVPTKTSHLTNDSGFLTAHQTIKQDGITGAEINRFGTCDTAAATAAKTVSITTGTFALAAGSIVAVKFTNANTANNPTLNVNSKGAKNIWVNGARITSGANKALLQGTVVFVYDGTQWNLIGNYYDTDTTYTGDGLISVNASTHVISTTATANTGTVTKVSTGAGLTGGDIQTSGTIKCDLKSESKSSLTATDRGSTSGREYPVGLDKNGDLSVNVPWTDTSGNDKVAKAGDTMTGDLILYKEGTTAQDYPTSLFFQNKDTTTGKSYTDAYIKAFQDHTSTTYGVNFVMKGGGCLFIGAGESPIDHYNALKPCTNEITYITSDHAIHLQANANGIANRKGLQITDSHELVPDVADTATNNVGSIGTSSYKWANMYATNLNGVAIGNSPKFTDENVKQTNDDSTTTALPILIANSTTNNQISAVKKSTKLTFEPSHASLAITGTYNSWVAGMANPTFWAKKPSSGSGGIQAFAADTKNGRFGIGTYASNNDTVYFQYFTNTKISAGTNTVDGQMSMDYQNQRFSVLNGVINTLHTGTGEAGSTSGDTKTPALWIFDTAQNLGNGDILCIKAPNGGHANGVLLTLDNGTTYKPVIIGHSGASLCTTHYGSGVYLLLVYENNTSVSAYPSTGGTATQSYTGCWRVVNYRDTNDNYYDRNRYNVNITAGAAITQKNIIVARASDGKYVHLKTNKVAFDIRYPILYANADIASGATGSNNYDILNIAIATTQSLTLTAYKPVYIKGTLNGYTFTTLGTAPLTQTVPSSDENYVYMLLGIASSTANVYLTLDHRIFTFNGSFRELDSLMNGGSITGSLNVSNQISTQDIYITSPGSINFMGDAKQTVLACTPGNNTVTLPSSSGTLALVGDIPSLDWQGPVTISSSSTLTNISSYINGGYHDLYFVGCLDSTNAIYLNLMIPVADIKAIQSTTSKPRIFRSGYQQSSGIGGEFDIYAVVTSSQGTSITYDIRVRGGLRKDGTGVSSPSITMYYR